MTIVHRIALTFAVAALAWLGLLLAVAAVHGRAWVRERTSESLRGLVRGRPRRQGVLGRPLAASRSEPVTFTPRGWSL